MSSLIRSLPLPFFLFFTGIFAAMVVLAVFVAIRTRKRAGLIAATPTSHIGFAKDGYVEFEGVTQPVNGLTLKAPLTGAACVWYHAKLEKWQRSSSSETNTHSWAHVWEVTSSEPFFMRDGSGTCIVYPYGAEVTFTDQSVWFGSTKVPADKNPERTGPGNAPEGILRIEGTPGKEFRYTEQRIYPGDPLYALGEFATAAWAPEEADAADEEDDEVEEGDLQDATDDDPDWDGHPGAASRFNEIGGQAAAITSRRLQRPKSRPYLLSTTPQAKLQHVHDAGWKGALFVSIVPAAIVALLIWLRFW